MPCLRYLPDQTSIALAAGQSVLEASLAAKVPFAHACGGLARCSTCRVLVLEGGEHCSPPSGPEQELADRLNFDTQTRLACQLTAHGDLTLRRLVLDSEDELLASQSAQAGESLPGEERQLAILFADIAGFTEFSEPLLPYDVVHSLNRYYHYIGQVIAAHEGVINNYVGDGFMALFGLKGGRSARQAVQAGLAMLETVQRLAPYYEALYQRSFGIRIGLHFGEVVLGSVGFLDNKVTTVIGDAVNFASRIESANKELGTRFLISEAFRFEIGEEIEVRACSPLKIRGKSGAHVLYEVLGLRFGLIG